MTGVEFVRLNPWWRFLKHGYSDWPGAAFYQGSILSLEEHFRRHPWDGSKPTDGWCIEECK